MKKLIVLLAAVGMALAAQAEQWRTFGVTPGGERYSQVGYVEPDKDGWVTIQNGAMTVKLFKTQVWYVKLP